MVGQGTEHPPTTITAKYVQSACGSLRRLHPDAGILSKETSKSYWDNISKSFTGKGKHALWRAHSDRVNNRWLSQWTSERRYAALLKTDLFDESITDGLYPYLSERSAQVHGIDLSPCCVKAAMRRFPAIRGKCADIRDLSLASEQFDGVVSTSTLDHFENKEDIKRSLEEIYRVMKPGGDLFITMDNLQNPAVRLRSILPYRWLHAMGLLPYFVGQTYRCKELVNSLEAVGFKIRKTSYLLHCPRTLAVPVTEWYRKRRSASSCIRLLEALLTWERLEHWISAGFTGHFIAAHAVKPVEPASIPAEQG